MRYLFTLLFLLLVACQPAASPIMDPGAECLTCHSGNASHVWTLAGTVYDDPSAAIARGVQGAQILVVDSDGKTLTLRTNESGNFYTAESLKFPVQVQVQKGNVRIGMDGHPATGTCNTCHGDPPQDEALGRIFVSKPAAP